MATAGECCVGGNKHTTGVPVINNVRVPLDETAGIGQLCFTAARCTAVDFVCCTSGNLECTSGEYRVSNF